MQRQLAAFVEQPCKTTYLAVRESVLRESSLPLLAVELAELDSLLDEGEYQLLRDRLDALPPSKVLSPRVHFLAAEAAEALGDATDVELERSLFVITLRGLLATGDGSPANPYVVCHPTDEYDVVTALGAEPAGQQVVEQEGHLCDVVTCGDGREVWFDVTDILAQPRVRRRTVQQRLKRRRPRVSRVAR
jgi:hypothetical protein